MASVVPERLDERGGKVVALKQAALVAISKPLTSQPPADRRRFSKKLIARALADTDSGAANGNLPLGHLRSVRPHPRLQADGEVAKRHRIAGIHDRSRPVG